MLSQYRLINEWMDEFHALYSMHDSARTHEEIWISCMAYFSNIGEAIRKSDYDELLQKATHAFNWMCTFVTKCNMTEDLLFKCSNSFCDMVYMKFPRVCGHCTKSECGCNPFEMDKKADKAGKYKSLYSKWKTCRDLKFSMTDWILMFEEIYGGRIYLQTMENIGFHFLEEAGEEAQAVRGLTQMRGVTEANIEGVDNEFLGSITSIEGLVSAYESCLPKDLNISYSSRDPQHIKARLVKAKMDLIIEFADTFSWFCAILVKLKMVAMKIDKVYDFEKALESEYGKKGQALICPTCKEKHCICQFFPAIHDRNRLQS